MNFMDAVKTNWKQKHTLLCVGLDPDPRRLPEAIRRLEQPLWEFNKAIVEATADLVCAFKPQMAYYAAVRAEDQLERTIAFIHDRYPGLPVILDAKRGDIGSTAEQYAVEAFDRYGADAVTVNPYMGGDTLRPFLERADKGVVILCRTSNPGASDFQDLTAGGKKLYEMVAAKATAEWNGNGNVALVAGATYPDELREIRALVGDMPLLVPGIGAQGGDVEAAVAGGRTKDGAGLMINVSRSVIFADSGDGFAAAARHAATVLRDEINLYR